MDLEAKSTTSSWIGLILSACALPALIWVSLYGHPALGFSGLVAEQQTTSAPAPLVSVPSETVTPQTVAEVTDSSVADADTVTPETPESTETLAERPAEADAADALPETTPETTPETAPETAIGQTIQDASLENEPALPEETGEDNIVALKPGDRSIGDPPPSLEDSTDSALAQVDSKTTKEGTDVAAEAPEYDEVAAQAKLAAVVEKHKTSESAALEKAGERAREMAREHELQLAAREKADELADAQARRENQVLTEAGEKARQMARDRKAQLLAAEAALQLEQQEKAAAASLKAREAQVAMQDQALLDAGERARQLASEYQAQQLALAAEQAAAEEEATRLKKVQAEQQEQALVDAGNKARQMLKEREEKQLAERESARQQRVALEEEQADRQNQALIAAGNRARELAREAQVANHAERQREQQNQALLAAGEKTRDLARQARAAKQLEQQNQALVAAGNKARELAREAQAAKLAARQVEQQNQALVAAGDKARELAKTAKLTATGKADPASLKLELSADRALLSAVMTEDEIAESVLDKLVALLAPLPVTEDISYFSNTRGGEQLLESLDLLVNELSASDVTLSDAEMTLEITENSITAEGQLDSEENAEALHAMLQSVFTDRDLSIRLHEQSSSSSGDNEPADKKVTTEASGQEPAEDTFEAIRARELALLTEQSENLNFKPGEWVISQPLRKPLDLIFETLFLYSEVTVNLTIYAGDSDDNIMNKFVSQQRARSIRRYLTDRGLEADRVKAIGAGNPGDGPVAEIEVMIEEN